VLLGLDAVHVDKKHPIVQRSIAWLKKVQQPSGAWGESCHSYQDPSTAGQGPRPPSQTAWALIGLMAAGEGHSEAVRRGHRLPGSPHSQNDGNWHEDEFTGTGFPKVFTSSTTDRLYFPLMALARFLHCQSDGPARNGKKHGAPRTTGAPPEKTPKRMGTGPLQSLSPFF